IMNEPKLRAWVQESVPPASDYDERPGRWVAERQWLPRRRARRFHLGDGRLLDRRARSELRLTHRSPLVTGITWGEWCPYGFRAELPSAQRPDDGRSLCFDSGPLAEPMDMLGAPVAQLRIAVDKPIALIAARLCDVAPDGSSRLMSYGILNLTHRDGHEGAVPMKPGEAASVRLQLNGRGEGVAAGHRLRLALSTGYWPMAWPSPEPVTLTVHAHESVLELPVRPSQAEPALPDFPPPEMASPIAVTRSRQGRR